MCFCPEDTRTGEAGETENTESHTDHEDDDSKGESGVARYVVLHPQHEQEGDCEEKQGVHHQHHIEHGYGALEAGQDRWPGVYATEFHIGLEAQLSSRPSLTGRVGGQAQHCGSNTILSPTATTHHTVHTMYDCLLSTSEHNLNFSIQVHPT